MAAFVLLLLGATNPAPCSLAMSGRVLDRERGEALPRVRIDLGGGKTALTDADGRYNITGLCAGAYRLRATRADHAVHTQTLQLRGDRRQNLLLDPVRVVKVADLVVEAPRLRQRDTRSVVALEDEALEKARGKDLADMLAALPGVGVLRSGNSTKPLVRGQSGARVLLLFDGVRHESQKWGLEHGPEIDPFAAGSMRVIKGPAGVRYGPDAIAGVLLLTPPPLLEAPGVRTSAQLIGASNGRRTTVATRVDGAHPWFGGRLAWRAEGNAGKGAALSTPTYPLDNTGTQEWNAAATVAYTGGDRTLKLSYRHNARRNGICNCVINDSAADFFAQMDRQRPLGAALYRVDFAIDRPFQAIAHDTALVRGQQQIAGVGDLEIIYAFQRNRRREYASVRQAIAGPQFDFTLRTHSVEATLAPKRLRLGGDRYLEGQIGLSGNVQENVFVGLPLIPNYRSVALGAFARERLSSAGFALELGARYDRLARDAYLDALAYARHRRRQSLSDTACTVRNDVARCPSSFDLGAFSLGGVLSKTDWLVAKLDLSTASRIPTIDEQYIDGAAPSFPVLAQGDPGLQAETSWTLSGAIELDTTWLSGEIAGFSSYIDDYIYVAPDLDTDGNPIVAIAIQGAFPQFAYRSVDALFYGGEAQATSRVGPIDVTAQASLVRAKDVANHQYLVLIPPDRYRVEVGYRMCKVGPLRKTTASINGAYITQQTRFDEAADFTAPPPSYFILGFNLSTSLRVGDTTITLSIAGENLLNTRYRDYTSLLRYVADEPGRQLIARLAIPNWTPTF